MSKMAETISKTTKFPTEVISSTPKLELTGNKTLYIENHKGIKILTPEQVIIKLKSGLIIAEGEKISIIEINRNYVYLTGIFNSFKFEKILE